MTVEIDAGQRQGPAPATDGSRLPLLLLCVAAAASGTLLLLLGSRLIFFLDDWEFLLYRPGWTADAILDPHGEHIYAVPVVIYKALQETFGMDSALPFRVVSTGLFLLSAVLLFIWLRRRVGEWLALIGAVLILFLGAAWEDLLWPFQVGVFASMAAGLGALLALEREDRFGDRLACLLLTVSIVFYSLGLAFTAGAAVDVWLRRREWRRRLYIVAIPAAVYALWWVGWGHEAETAVSLDNLSTTPGFVFNGIGAGLTSLLGLATPSVRSKIDVNPDHVLAPAALALVGLRIYRLGLRNVPRWFWVVLAIAAAFWVLGGLNEKPGRTPSASRYQYIGGIFILLVAAELLRGVRVGRRPLAVIAVIAALSVASNVKYLNDAYRSYKLTSDIERADLAALDITRDTVDRGFVLEENIADTGYVHVVASAYLPAAEKFGSPAYNLAELADAPDSARVPADKVLAAALGIRLAPTGHQLSSDAGGAAPVTLLGAEGSRRGACLTARLAAGRALLLRLPPGGVALQSGGGSLEASLRRFASFFPVHLGRLPPRSSAVLEIPRDRASRRWQLRLTGTGEVRSCGLGGT